MDCHITALNQKNRFLNEHSTLSGAFLLSKTLNFVIVVTLVRSYFIFFVANYPNQTVLTWLIQAV